MKSAIYGRLIPMSQVLYKKAAEVMGADYQDNLTIMAKALYDFLKSYGDTVATELFCYILRWFGYVPSHSQILPYSGMSAELISKIMQDKNLENSYLELIDRLLKSMNAQEVAKELWQFIQLLPHEEERIFILASSLQKPFTPVPDESDLEGMFVVQGQEYNQIKYQQGAIFNLILEIKKGIFKSMEERAMAILYQLAQISDPKARAVLMTAVLEPIVTNKGSLSDFPGVEPLDHQAYYNHLQEITQSITGMIRLNQLFTHRLQFPRSAKGSVLLHHIESQPEKIIRLYNMSFLLEMYSPKTVIFISPQVINLAEEDNFDDESDDGPVTIH